MRKTAVIFLTLFFCLNVILNGQVSQDPDTTLNIENAKYLKGDLVKLLGSNTKYPQEAVMNSIQGDVILSININSDGKMDRWNIVSSPDISLYNSSIASFSLVEDEWSPCKINGKPVDKKYLLVYRYRIYLNTQPPDYKERADKLLEKEKYERALKLYDRAIDDNQYDYKLFESRSKVKEILGDAEGSEKDYLEANRLRNEIISVVNIRAIGVTKTETRVERRIRY